MTDDDFFATMINFPQESGRNFPRVRGGVIAQQQQPYAEN